MPIKISAILDHDKVAAKLVELGEPPLPIPPGSNTAWRELTFEGHPAVVVNQTGFAPRLDDNEEPVNGYSFLWVEDPDVPEAAAREALRAFIENKRQ